ncbi:unnamed protein product, partial [Lampetra planeri]
MRRAKRGKETPGAQQQHDEAAGDFNPETSKRERRKLQTKLQQVDSGLLSPVHKPLPFTLHPPPLCRRRPPAPSRVYDSQGRLVRGGVDACDCLQDGCPGCFYPCSTCSSTRCGPTCRRDRRWLYERLETEGGGSIDNVYAS